MKTPKANVLALCPSAYLQELADDSTICIPVGDRKGPICLGRGINAREAWRSADRTLRVLRDALFQPADQGQTRQRIASFFDGKKPYTPAQMQRTLQPDPNAFPMQYTKSLHPHAECIRHGDSAGRYYCVWRAHGEGKLGEGTTARAAWKNAATTEQRQRSAAKR